VDGILILTTQRDLIYANDYIKRTLRQLNQCQSLVNQVPEEIWNVCQVLIKSHDLFPNQHWLIESKIFMSSSIAFNVMAKWLKLEELEQPCIWLSICDHCQYTQGIVKEESQKYGLTSREKEVWLLHRADYTYKQVALELHITPNTVKKHLKSIYSKQKMLSEPQEI
jgi:DNA-binding CsgD family transcriptional regulator